MYKVIWDKETRGVILTASITEETLGISPRPVFFEELDLLGLDKLGWIYPHVKEPLLWACNKQYYYRGEFAFDVRGANVYDDASVSLANGFKNLVIEPVDLGLMFERNKDFMFLLESEAIEFIRDTYWQYRKANDSVRATKANQLDYDELLKRVEKQRKTKMTIVKEDCDSFDIVPLDLAKKTGKKIYYGTKIDIFLASFSGGKDSQVILDLCTRAIPSNDFRVIYSDTGYELPTSLKLYEVTKKIYGKLYPDLKFYIAKNHEEVKNYWDKMGSPSNTKRWCCSVMKTAPLYRMLKIEGTNRQAKVLAFEGTRAEESSRRSSYNRIGKGVKHDQVINARPIFNWSTTEVFLYLLRNNIPINEAYRMGKPRVGCLICPFSSEWDDMIVRKAFPKELSPFLNRLVDWAKERKIPNLDEYIKGHKWKLRASGKFLTVRSTVDFEKIGTEFTAKVSNAKENILTWIKTIGPCSFQRNENVVNGEFKYKNIIYEIEIVYKDNANYKITFKNIRDITLIGLLKRVIYKTTHCIQCESCEVECPTGALSVYPKVVVDEKKCIHCYKCLEFHAKGCIVADSLSMTNNNNNKLTGISGYCTFGFRDEWLNEYSFNRIDFWNANSLGKKQVPSFKSWLKDASIIDAKKRITTPLGKLLIDMYQDNPDIAWEIIWINLVYNSKLVQWFVKNVSFEEIYSKVSLQSMYEDEYSEGQTTFRYALDALFNTFMSSPIGTDFRQKVEITRTESQRNSYEDISDVALAYSLYKYGEHHHIKSFRINDLIESEDGTGIFKEFGISTNELENKVRSLSNATSKMLIAELGMGLDHITLMDGIDSLSVVKQFLDF